METSYIYIFEKTISANSNLDDRRELETLISMTAPRYENSYTCELVRAIRECRALGFIESPWIFGKNGEKKRNLFGCIRILELSFNVHNCENINFCNSNTNYYRSCSSEKDGDISIKFSISNDLAIEAIRDGTKYELVPIYNELNREIIRYDFHFIN